MKQTTIFSTILYWLHSVSCDMSHIVVHALVSEGGTIEHETKQ